MFSPFQAYCKDISRIFQHHRVYTRYRQQYIAVRSVILAPLLHWSLGKPRSATTKHARYMWFPLLWSGRPIYLSRSKYSPLKYRLWLRCALSKSMHCGTATLRAHPRNFRRGAPLGKWWWCDPLSVWFLLADMRRHRRRKNNVPPPNFLPPKSTKQNNKTKQKKQKWTQCLTVTVARKN